MTMLWWEFLILSIWLLQTFAEATVCRTGHNIYIVCFDCCYGIPLKDHKDIPTVLSCSTLCSEDPKCRSWQFNQDSQECWTNEGVMPLSTMCPQRIRYGEVTKAPCRPLRMNDPCIRDSDCSFVNSVCHRGKCNCKNGHPYDSRTDSCLTGCTEYGSTANEAYYSLVVWPNKFYFVGTLVQCQSLCFTATEFVCRFMEYKSRTGDCYLYEETAVTKPQSLRDFLPPGWQYWDRNCA